MSRNLASTMRQRIQIQSFTATANGEGGYTTTWNDFADLWADVQPLSGTENYDAEQIEDIESVQFTIRYLDGVMPSMRISFNGDYYAIRSIINTGLKNQMLEILAERKNI